MFWKIGMKPNFKGKFYDKCHKIEVKVGYSAQREPSQLTHVLTEHFFSRHQTQSIWQVLSPKLHHKIIIAAFVQR
jgi:hypothetical protein